MPASLKLVTGFGGSGFLGRYVVRALTSRGYKVRVACRRPDLAGHLQPLGNVGQIQYIQANLRYRWSIDRAVEGADAVVNLVGILSESGRQTFDAVQARGAGWVAQAVAKEGAAMVQMSALGADADSPAEYAQTKSVGERSVREAVPSAIIFRPSILFGPEDEFFNRFAGMAKMSPFLPLIGGGGNLFQPVYVGDVAQAVVNAVDGKLSAGSTWELGGPEMLSFKQCLKKMLPLIERKPVFISLPFAVARTFARLLQYLPGAPLTPGQVDLLKTDNIVSQDAADEGRTLAGAGVQATSMMSVLPDYLVRFRKHGEFQANRGL